MISQTTVLSVSNNETYRLAIADISKKKVSAFASVCVSHCHLSNAVDSETVQEGAVLF